MRERLIFMADYTADPLWATERPGGMVDLDTLPLTQATRDAVRAWARRVDTLSYEAIDEARPVADEDAAALAAEEQRLWLRLREELADTHEIGLREPGGSVRWEP